MTDMTAPRARCAHGQQSGTCTAPQCWANPTSSDSDARISAAAQGLRDDPRPPRVAPRQSVPEPEFKPGDWVQVYAQVIEDHPAMGDVNLDVFSHNTQYQAMVRRDRVKACAPPEFAGRCNHMNKSGLADTLVRCRWHHNHGGDHAAWVGGLVTGGSLAWTDAETYGYIEEK